jgi:hypothetical protein
MTRNDNEGENEVARPSNEEMHAKPSQSLNTFPIDPERLAALIDGRLDPEARAALLAELDASPEALEAYGDAMAALRDTAEESAISPGGGVSLTSQRTSRPFRMYAPVLAIAAVVLIAVALPFVRGTRGPGLDDPRAIAALVQRTETAGTLWQRPAWSEVRGPSDALSARARAVRIGARIVDLDLLARTGDPAATRVALQAAALLDAVPAGGVAASAFRALADQDADAMSSDAFGQAVTFAEQVAGVTEVRAGAWLEAARMAASVSDASFFERARIQAARRAISSLAGLSAPARAALDELDRLLVDAPAPDWPAIESALSALLRELASG